ncbi:MAG: tape measure protein [Bacteroidales bacterium]|nr:tape measure protein [Lachnoclostridium sp.]MCM1465522.1 tape measure protein [Bacteroidales bacterium]
MEDMQQSMNADIDTSGIEGARESINQTTAALDALNAAMESQTAPDIAPAAVPGDSSGEPIPVPVNPVLPDPLVENPDPVPLPIQPNAPPEPVEVPVQWQSDGLEVFTTTGYERFQQEVQSANNMLNTLNQTQAQIEQTANGIDLLPDAAVQDISSLGQRLQIVQQRMQEISSNPVNAVSEDSNAQLEQLRGQLDGLIQQQNELNAAMESGDISDINAAYLQLSRNLNNTERFIRDNTDEQRRFTRSIQESTGEANELLNTIKGAIAAYVSIQSIGKVLNLSDELVETTARIDLMNDGLQTTDELVGMIYAAAQDSRGSFNEMADVVARFGNNAKEAFSSSAEVVAFADLVQKQMTIAGASTTEASNAMLQLSQGLASGVLRGDELNSIFEQAPNLIQNIADYLEIPIGQIRDMASEGALTADIVKNAIFASADDINAKFESMPMTFGQLWQAFQNDALMAFRPVLQRLNELANSGQFQVFLNNAIGLMAGLAEIALNIFDLIMLMGTLIADNWSMISPVVYGVVGALAAYVAYMAIVKAVEMVSTGIKMAMCVAAYAHAAATGAEVAATTAQTAAQLGLNTAILACPITWIILAIMALIAVVIAVANYIANLGGTATTAFGVICGGVNVVIQFFKNLGLMVANIALGIGNAIEAVASNIMTAFQNAICSVQSWWYDLLSTVLNVTVGICEALNELPFVEFDYSDIVSAADDYAEKSAEAAGNRGNYKSIANAFSEGFTTFDAFGDGWISDAYAAGAAWGDDISDRISDMFTPGDTTDYTEGLDVAMSNAIGGSGMPDNLDNIAGSTGSIADAMDITEEDLKYLRDIAEQEAVNRFTTAEIKVDMTNHNNINSGMDLDGVVSSFADGVNEAVETMAEGVHD